LTTPETFETSDSNTINSNGPVNDSIFLDTISDGLHSFVDSSTVETTAQTVELRRSIRKKRPSIRLADPPESPVRNRRRVNNSSSSLGPQTISENDSSPTLLTNMNDDPPRTSTERETHGNVSDNINRTQAFDDGYSLHRHNNSVSPHSCGLMTEVCPHCLALYFPSEVTTRGHYYRCCLNGATTLRPLRESTPFIRSLLTNNHPLSAHFLQNILYYNNSMAMASIGIKMYKFPNRGPPVVKINGLSYHNTLMLTPDNDRRKYAKLYVGARLVAVGLVAEVGPGRPVAARDLELFLRVACLLDMAQENFPKGSVNHYFYLVLLYS